MVTYVKPNVGDVLFQGTRDDLDGFLRLLCICMCVCVCVCVSVCVSVTPVTLRAHLTPSLLKHSTTLPLIPSPRTTELILLTINNIVKHGATTIENFV